MTKTSVPAAPTVLALLKADNDLEGLAKLRKALRGWKCTNCELTTKNVGVLREGEELTLYCPFCSGVRVRSERVEIEGKGFSISGPR